MMASLIIAPKDFPDMDVEILNLKKRLIFDFQDGLELDAEISRMMK
jgi:hypothetical protein